MRAQSARAESKHEVYKLNQRYLSSVYLWGRLCTLYLLNTLGTTQAQPQRPGSTTVTLTWLACKYKVHQFHHRCSLRIESYFAAIQTFVFVLVWRLSGVNYLPCVLILHERSVTRSVSDLYLFTCRVRVTVGDSGLCCRGYCTSHTLCGRGHQIYWNLLDNGVWSTNLFCFHCSR